MLEKKNKEGLESDKDRKIFSPDIFPWKATQQHKKSIENHAHILTMQFFSNISSYR